MKLIEMVLSIIIFIPKFKNKRGSPLVEEAILLGVALFIFLILGLVIFDLIGFATGVFDGFSNFIEDFPN